MQAKASEERSGRRVVGQHRVREGVGGVSRLVDAMAAMRRFRAMSRRTARDLVLGMLLAGALACDRPAPPPGNDTSAVSPPPLPPPPAPMPAGEAAWDSSAGPVFLTIGPNGSTANIIFPSLAADDEVDGTRLDAAPYTGRTFDLLGNGQLIGSATLSALVPADAPEECSGWPLVQLTGVPGDSSARAWAVAFERGRVQAVAYDSLSALTGTDSSRLAMEVSRVAIRVPGDTVAAMLGLPYQVRRAYRFLIAPGVEGVVAEVVRTLNQEANPQQEHLLLVAERDSTTRGGYDIAYSERAAGGEESAESSELLTIARLSPSRDVVIVLARYVGDGVVYAWLERTENRRWRLRWSSPYAGC